MADPTVSSESESCGFTQLERSDRGDSQSDFDTESELRRRDRRRQADRDLRRRFYCDGVCPCRQCFAPSYARYGEVDCLHGVRMTDVLNGRWMYLNFEWWARLLPARRVLPLVVYYHEVEHLELSDYWSPVMHARLGTYVCAGCHRVLHQQLRRFLSVRIRQCSHDVFAFLYERSRTAGPRPSDSIKDEVQGGDPSQHHVSGKRRQGHSIWCK